MKLLCAGCYLNIEPPPSPDNPGTRQIREHIILLRGYATDVGLLAALPALLETSPWRHMFVPGGGQMSVATSNCGQLGWTSDRAGYRYLAVDPLTNKPWPAMPLYWKNLARRAATAAGFGAFEPDACLMNQYLPGARLGLHRDHDEAEFIHPVVSVSFGASARMVIGGLRRADRTEGLMLHHGDALIWGGPQRLVYHGVGVPRIAQRNPDQIAPAFRLNLTFRKAG